jgi:hypothetical protein
MPDDEMSVAAMAERRARFRAMLDKSPDPAMPARLRKLQDVLDELDRDQAVSRPDHSADETRRDSNCPTTECPPPPPTAVSIIGLMEDTGSKLPTRHQAMKRGRARNGGTESGQISMGSGKDAIGIGGKTFPERIRMYLLQP